VIYFVLPAAAFLLGSVPCSFLIGRSRGVDLRARGSGNIGATNLTRSCGRGAGAAGLLLDAVKGALPVAAAALVGAPAIVRAAAALAAVAGHVFSPWLRFRGGKGVATGLGAVGALAPLPAAAALAVFLLVFAWTRIVSASSMAAAVALVPAVLVLGRPGAKPFAAVSCVAVALLILVRHASNISRLIRGTEGGLAGGRGRR